MSAIIEIQGLSKAYKIGASRKYQSLRDNITSLPQKIFKPEKHNTFMALDNINLEIREGECMGVIGRNGAGKSTLLKILSRITPPTIGSVLLRGKVASLLEVGTGFHTELTGRENIYFNGSILGMRRKEINAKFDEIVDFSGTETFLDTPLKHYSSGMKLRLAFAVAAHLHADILLMDEVLAVGDIGFQRKCLQKMENLSSEEGRTILFVSHNLNAILNLTTTCICLDGGKIVSQGNSKKVIEDYAHFQESSSAEYTNLQTSENPYISQVSIVTSEEGSIQKMGKEMQIYITANFPNELKNAAISYQILDSLQRPIIHILNKNNEVPFGQKKGIYKLESQISKVRLYPGLYTLKVHFADAHTRIKYDTLTNICPFSVIADEFGRDYYWEEGSAIYREDHSWNIQEIKG